MMGRLAKVEASVVALAADVTELKAAAWRTTEILVDHSEQLGDLRRGVAALNERVDGLNERVDGLNERVDGLGGKMDGVNERLDRLIAVTIQGRTADTERFGEIERRLARLEQRVGL
jgi:chromosome segregation ATPase